MLNKLCTALINFEVSREDLLKHVEPLNEDIISSTSSPASSKGKCQPNLGKMSLTGTPPTKPKGKRTKKVLAGKKPEDAIKVSSSKKNDDIMRDISHASKRAYELFNKECSRSKRPKIDDDSLSLYDSEVDDNVTDTYYSMRTPSPVSIYSDYAEPTQLQEAQEEIKRLKTELSMLNKSPDKSELEFSAQIVFVVQALHLFYTCSYGDKKHGITFYF